MYLSVVGSVGGGGGIRPLGQDRVAVNQTFDFSWILDLGLKGDRFMAFFLNFIIIIIIISSSSSSSSIVICMYLLL